MHGAGVCRPCRGCRRYRRSVAVIVSAVIVSAVIMSAVIVRSLIRGAIAFVALIMAVRFVAFVSLAFVSVGIVGMGVVAMLRVIMGFRGIRLGPVAALAIGTAMTALGRLGVQDLKCRGFGMFVLCHDEPMPTAIAGIWDSYKGSSNWNVNTHLARP